MGNSNGRPDGAFSGNAKSSPAISNDSGIFRVLEDAPLDSMSNSSPETSGCSRSSVMFVPQMMPVAFQKEKWQSELSPCCMDLSTERGIPTLINWSYGGNDISIEGSWDNWRSRKKLQKSGKDHSILLVMPLGVYHYRFIVDGRERYSPDRPYIPGDKGAIYNILDVHGYIPEFTDGIAELDAPPSPESSYSQPFPDEEDFGKEPITVPPQLELITVPDVENLRDEDLSSSLKPQHVVLNHMFLEKGWASQSVVSLGLTHRFRSKYVTVVLYKPLRR